MASFQALIEYNLFCPESIKDLSASEIRFHIEAFWDSGVARIGENGAKGWKSWAAIQTMKKADPFSLSGLFVSCALMATLLSLCYHSGYLK